MDEPVATVDKSMPRQSALACSVTFSNFIDRHSVGAGTAKDVAPPTVTSVTDVGTPSWITWPFRL